MTQRIKKGWSAQRAAPPMKQSLALSQLITLFLSSDTGGIAKEMAWRKNPSLHITRVAQSASLRFSLLLY
jgi:hypothetical protein